ncbi:hypothetical protein J3R83DRAFT_5077 [Lanmaoa asiatica]|nr:hypothetical protein J3R83DRAFT_5077 [Lanmaoa asiatica]
MSSPIPIPYTSRGLYVPVHRRTPSNSSRTPSPSPSSFSSSRTYSSITITLPADVTHTVPAPVPGVYTPAELLLLSASPLAKLSAGHVDALRALAPEVVQTRRQRKALTWHTRHPAAGRSASHTHGRTPSCGSSHASESEEDKAITWRRV